LIPGLEIRCFDLEDGAAAEAWLAHVDGADADIGDNMPV
jgi:hypothetical protein